MCTHGDVVILDIGGRPRDIDRCIAPLVTALNEHGFVTVASCCGHSFRPGTIMLADGRELIVARNYTEARAIDGLFPLNIHGQVWDPHKREWVERRPEHDAQLEAWAARDLYTSSIEQRITDYKAVLDEVRAINDQLRKQVGDLKRSATEVMRAHDTLVSLREKRIAKLEQEIETQRSVHAQRGTRLQEALSERNRLARALDQATARIAQLERGQEELGHE